VCKVVKVGEFFDNNDIPEIEDHFVDIPYDVKVKTPYGYYSIPQVCRTVRQKSIRLYFTNNRTLECGWDHKLKVNGDWKVVSEINIETDLVETDRGFTKIKKIHEGSDKILYDLAVDTVHCFYSNGVLSHNTWILSAIGAAAVKAGKTVVHYTLELSENYVGQRYDTIFTHIPTVNHQDRKDEISDKIGKLKGKLLIKYFPPKGVTTRKLEAHIDKMIASGNKPDLIIIDYADLMLTNSGRVENTYAEQGGIYIDLRGMGGEYGIPTWTASQTQRSAIDSDVIEADKIADSYAKVMNADFIISVSRKSTDKLNNTARVYVMKNRFGPDGITFPAKMNTNDGFIEVYDSKSSDGILAQKEASNGKEVERKLLHKKYVETMPTANLNELG
jgi:hypothetical protein